MGPPVTDFATNKPSFCSTQGCTSSAYRMRGAGSRSDEGQSSTQKGRSELRHVASRVVHTIRRTPRLYNTRIEQAEIHLSTYEETCAALASASRLGHRHRSECRAAPTRGGRTAYSDLEPALHRMRPRATSHRSCRGRWPPHAPLHMLGHLAEEAFGKHEISRERGL